MNNLVTDSTSLSEVTQVQGLQINKGTQDKISRPNFFHIAYVSFFKNLFNTFQLQETYTTVDRNTRKTI